MSKTYTDNMQDKSRKGRVVIFRGEDHTNAKLTENDVRRIRKLRRLREEYKKYTDTFLAKMFRVDRALIRRIGNRSAWKHVED